MTLALIGNARLRNLIGRNLVTFPAQIPPLASRGSGDIAHRVAQLYFIRRWPLRNICARYALGKAGVQKLLADWRIRAIEAGFIQEIEPGTVAGFLPTTGNTGVDRSPGDEATRLSRAMPKVAPLSTTRAGMELHESHMGAKLLIMHEDAPARRLLHGTFLNLGWEVNEAGTGDEVLDVCRYVPFEAVVLDMVTPGENGGELCRQLRELNPRVAIVVISNNVDLERNIDLLEAGADDYVTRPFHPAELAARIRAALRHSRAATSYREEIAVTADPGLYADGRLVVLPAATIDLTPREPGLVRLSRPHIPAGFSHIHSKAHPVGEVRLARGFPPCRLNYTSERT